jgi:hypothetical protein
LDTSALGFSSLIEEIHFHTEDVVENAGRKRDWTSAVSKTKRKPSREHAATKGAECPHKEPLRARIKAWLDIEIIIPPRPDNFGHDSAVFNGGDDERHFSPLVECQQSNRQATKCS